MLPTITVILTICLLDATSSPVYNMQPAYITANIGTTGRNIRNLPCISRKSNQHGVCMFAIDCLKANGTHLGTCIDRFYFGSCCHVDQIHEILDNDIDSSIFPDREPPSRIHSTERTTDFDQPEKATQLLENTTKPTIATKESTSTKMNLVSSTTVTTPKLDDLSSKISTVLTKEPTTTINLLHKLTTYQSVDGIINDVTTLKPISYTKPTIINKYKTTVKSTTSATTQHKTTSNLISSATKLSTIQVQLLAKPTASKITQTNSTTLISSKPSSTKPIISVTKPLPSKITQKPTTPILIKTTTKPTSSVKSTTKPTQKPIHIKSTTLKPIKPSSKPTSSIKQTVKPSRATTRRPPTTAKISSTKFTKPTTTSKSSTTTPKPITKLKFTTVKSTTTPKIKTTTEKKTTTTSSLTSTTKVSILENGIIDQEIMRRPITESVEKESTTSINVPIIDIILTTTSKTPVSISSEPQIAISSVLPPKLTSTESNIILNNAPLNISSNPNDVNGNTATNEIESIRPLVESTTKPTLITWTVTNEEPTVSSLNTTNEDWVPITTPDGWVLLPSVSSTTSNDTISNSTSSPASTEIIFTQTTFSTTEATSSTLMMETSTKEPNITNAVTDSLETTDVEINTNISEIDISENLVNMSDFTDVCGRRMNPKARIVGGENSSYGKWPWQISLRQWRTSTYLHKCGAALLNENWAITAAHCVDSVPPSDLLLRLGEHDLSTESEPYLHQERRVQIVASHPQFDPRTFEYDLALLRFYEPVKFQPNILPVCVPQDDDDFIGKSAHVTGWGRLYEDGPLPSILQEVSVPVINNTLCESMYRSAGYIEHIPHIFICAGWRRGGFDSCEGDSGGPMVIQRSDNRFLLAGVISWGIGCAEPNQPGVYTRISEFRDWINQILQF